MLKVTVELGGKVLNTFTTDKVECFIGRNADNHIQIDNLGVSGRHARIVKENGAYTIEDLDSTNGTFVDGKKVSKQTITDKSRITIGKYNLSIHSSDGQPKAPNFIETMKVETKQP